MNKKNSEAQNPNQRRKWIRLSGILGIGIFVYLVLQTGIQQIWSHVTRIPWPMFLILLGLRIIYWGLRTYCWKSIVEVYQPDISFITLLTARMCGHSVSQLTPTAQLGSEATRILMARCINIKISIASVILDKTVEFLAIILLIIPGLILAFYHLPLSPQLKSLLIGTAFIAMVFILFLIKKQKKGIFNWLTGLFSKIKIQPRFIRKHQEGIEEADLYIKQFYSKHRPALFRTLGMYFLLVGVWTLEIHLGFIFLGVDQMSLTHSFIITILGNIAFVFPFIPGSIGVYEATYMGLFSLLGGEAKIALALVLIRRVMALLLAGAGLAGLYRRDLNKN